MTGKRFRPENATAGALNAGRCRASERRLAAAPVSVCHACTSRPRPDMWALRCRAGSLGAFCCAGAVRPAIPSLQDTTLSALAGRSRITRSRAPAQLIPQAVAAQKRVGVRAEAHTLRQLLHQFRIAAAEHDVFDVERPSKAIDDIEDVPAPFLLAAAFHARLADVILVALTFFVRKMGELHRHQHAVDDERRAQPGTEAEK